MRDRLAREKITLEREAFIGSLDRRAICDLASSHHDGAACRIFGMKHGSFNICFFVEFDSPPDDRRPDRWVVRILFPGRVPWVDEKIDSEVATMKYVRRETTIPVPEVVAFAYTADSPIGLGFIIIQYVEGTTLHALGFRYGQKWDDKDGRLPSPATARIYEQLADVYGQLRRLEFPEIGALGMPTEPGEDIAVRHRPMPLELPAQQSEGLDPTYFFPEKKTFKTALEYIMATVRLDNNLAQRTRDPDLGDDDAAARRVLYAYYHFCTYVSKNFTLDRGSLGPYVLMHGDMSLHGDNLVWDKDLNLVSVVDWEWSHMVPVQCFIPPAWLSGFHPEPIAYISNGHGRKRYQDDLSALCRTVGERWPASPLPREWQRMCNASRHLIFLAMLYPAMINDVYWRCVDFKMHPLRYESVESVLQYWKATDERVAKFFDQEQRNADWLQRRLSVRDRFDAEYESYLAENGGEPRLCQCERCREDKENFDSLRQLPLLLLEPQ